MWRNTFHTQNLEQFAKDVNASSAGKLVITVHPGASLFKQPEIKRAIQTGLVPMGEFIISGQSNENPLFGVDSIPFLATSYVEARKLYDAARPVQQKVLAGQGLKLLYCAVAGPVAIRSAPSAGRTISRAARCVPTIRQRPRLRKCSVPRP